MGSSTTGLGVYSGEDGSRSCRASIGQLLNSCSARNAPAHFVLRSKPMLQKAKLLNPLPAMIPAQALACHCLGRCVLQ